jgi:hypothetical protein
LAQPVIVAVSGRPAGSDHHLQPHRTQLDTGSLSLMGLCHGRRRRRPFHSDLSSPGCGGLWWAREQNTHGRLLVGDYSTGEPPTPDVGPLKQRQPPSYDSGGAQADRANARRSATARSTHRVPASRPRRIHQVPRLSQSGRALPRPILPSARQRHTKPPHEPTMNRQRATPRDPGSGRNRGRAGQLQARAGGGWARRSAGLTTAERQQLLPPTLTTSTLVGLRNSRRVWEFVPPVGHHGADQVLGVSVTVGDPLGCYVGFTDCACIED